MRTNKIDVVELTQILVKAELLSEEQEAEVRVKATTQAARLTRNQGTDSFGRNRTGSVSPAEVIASFELRVGGDPKGAPLDEDRITRCLAEDAEIPFETIDPLELDEKLITQTISLPFARRTSVLPLRREEDSLVVAVTDPYDVPLFDELERITASKLSIVLSPRSDIQASITKVYGFSQSVARAAQAMTPKTDLGDLEQLVTLGKIDELEADDRHVISAVEYILHYAFDQRASDVHIEPKRNHCAIRMRIDGVLHDVYQIPKAVHPAVVTRIKTLTRLDLAERRRPQDGRFKTDREGEEVEMRVSTLPVAFGEKVVIRIFDPAVFVRDLEELGFEEEAYGHFEEFISRPNGLVLVTGPTGSGKTTTLYSALKYLSSPELNITTIEDPIEMIFEEFNQTAVHPKIGLDFATSLRHILRQDPDVVMVGEIRDPETAAQALQAALTGHLVFSTLHTNDSATSVTRLLELGMDPFLVSSTLVGVVAQRLVRRVCESCRAELTLSPEQMAVLDIQMPPGKEQTLTVAEGEGCTRCRGTGLYGRTAIFEILTMSDSLRALVNESADATAILRSARAEGTETLREAAVRKLALGETSYDEVIRVTIDEDAR